MGRGVGVNSYGFWDGMRDVLREAVEGAVAPAVPEGRTVVGAAGCLLAFRLEEMPKHSRA